MKTRESAGNRSKKKLKNSISATNMIEPGNPRNIRRFTSATKKSLGQRKLTPLISVINRVLNRRPMASTRRNEFVESRAWLISIQKLANIRED
jgi:hypothetical protein